MKKIISIAFIALSSLLLLIMTVVPHHHHKGLACMIIEICDEDNNVNDEHTSHSTIPFESQQGETCVADAEYTAPQSNKENQCKVASCADNHIIHLFPLYYVFRAEKQKPNRCQIGSVFFVGRPACRSVFFWRLHKDRA